MMVSSSEKTPLIWPVMNEIPRNSVPRIAAIEIRVRPAFRLRGSLKAVMPLEIASTPVNAVVPLEKACSSKNGVMAAKVLMTLGSGGLTIGPNVPVRCLTIPVPTVRNIIPMKKYAGTAKKAPDSLTPRRLTSMMNSTAATASQTR